MQQADEFLQETEDLARLLVPLAPADYDRVTQFKGWTVDDVLAHLHLFNMAADDALRDPPAFDRFWQTFQAHRRALGMTGATRAMLPGLSGRALCDQWLTRARTLAARYGAADPKARIPWVGPAMSARSSITARQMETWAHGQEIHDLLGHTRIDTDRLRNICHLGVSTFGWAFANRGEPVPETPPYLSLTAPSGALWTWNDAAAPDRIEGPASAFCQVVTQTRNIADTGLVVTGPVAARWMAIAQCFAGPPETPPAPGTRGPV